MKETTTTSKRPSRISVTFLLRPTTACNNPALTASTEFLWDFLGLGMCRNRCQGQLLVQIVRNDSVLTNKLLEGDILETINGCSCHNVEITDVWAMLIDTSTRETSSPEELDSVYLHGRLATLTFHCPQGNSDIVSAIAIPPSYNHDDMAELYRTGNDSDMIPCDLGLSLEIVPSRRSLKRNCFKRLTIHQVSSNGWLSGSVLMAGDVVQSINDQSTDGWSLDDISGILNAAKTGYTTIAITATTVHRRKSNNNKSSSASSSSSSKDIATNTDDEKPTWKQKVRRASVTVGGGVMVTTGAVLMVTPLHPVGHAMAIGGVAMLGGFRRNKGKTAAQQDDVTKESDLEMAGDDEISPKDVGSLSAVSEIETVASTVSGDEPVTDLERQASS